MGGWRGVVAAAVAGLVGCGPLEGGGGTVPFTRGFAFVRQGDVFVVDEAGEVSLPLRLTEQAGAHHPALSRDGRQVVYIRQAGGVSSLEVVPTRGGEPTRVLDSVDPGCGGCTGLRHPTFSPDGRSIAVTLERGGVSSLALVEVDGTGLRRLASRRYSYGAPCFSPDGRSVLAPAGPGPGQLVQLMWVDVASGQEVAVGGSLGEARAVVSRAVVSPDGSRVAFDGQRADGSVRLYVAPLGSRGLGPVVQVTEHPGEPSAWDTWPSWRGNAELGFLSSAGGTDSIYLISASAVRGSGRLVVPSAAEPSYGGH